MKAVPRTCPGCMDADHEQHNYGWNLNRWTGKGAYCPCEGECIALLDLESRMFAAYHARIER